MRAQRRALRIPHPFHHLGNLDAALSGAQSKSDFNHKTAHPRADPPLKSRAPGDIKCCPVISRIPVRHCSSQVRASRTAKSQARQERNRLRCRQFTSLKGTRMRRMVSKYFSLSAFFLAASIAAFSQSNYKVVAVTDGGTISGTVKWSGSV